MRAGHWRANRICRRVSTAQAHLVSVGQARARRAEQLAAARLVAGVQGELSCHGLQACSEATIGRVATRRLRGGHRRARVETQMIRSSRRPVSIRRGGSAR
jgi:hypothetical protein